MTDNIIVALIEKKMEQDEWTALTPDSYASYLFNLTDEEIKDEVDEKEIEGFWG